MSLSYPFPFWSVSEQKGNEVGRLLHRRPSLTWRNKISIQDFVPDIAYFCTEGDINLTTNQPGNTYELCKNGWIDRDAIWGWLT